METEDADLKDFACERCDKIARAKKLPPGWKRRTADALLCAECLASGFDLRSIALPIQSVLPAEGEPAADAWTAFRQAARISGTQAARVFNLAVARLLAADTEPLARSGDKTRLPPAPKGGELYALMRSECPDLDSQSGGSILQKARAAYREARWGVRVTGKEAPPFARAPAPVPMPDKDVRLTLLGPDEVPHAAFRLAGRRFAVRLASGGEWRRQVSSIRALAREELIGGEVKLIEKRSGGAHRNGGVIRQEPGANRRPTRFLLAFSVWLPRRERKPEAGRVLRCRTGSDRLWTVAVEGRDLWFLNEREIFRWLGETRHALKGQPDWLKDTILGYGDWRQRISEDRKFERRHGAERINLNATQQAKADRYHARLTDFCHKAARMLANLAARQRCESVEYDDSDTSYFPSFPWFKLRAMVAQKLAENNARFVHAAGSAAGPEAEALDDR